MGAKKQNRVGNLPAVVEGLRAGSIAASTIQKSYESRHPMYREAAVIRRDIDHLIMLLTGKHEETPDFGGLISKMLPD